MKNITNRLLLPSMAMLSIGTAHAGDSNWSVGLAAIKFESAFKGMESENYLVPLIEYKGDKLTFEGFTFDYKVYQSGSIAISTVLYPGSEFLDASKSNDNAVRALSDREISYFAGVKLKVEGFWGNMSSTIGHDITGHGKGINAMLDYGFPIQVGNGFIVTPMVGINFRDKDLSNYYYATGSAAGLDAYSLSSTIDGYVGVAAFYAIDRDWSLSFLAKYNDADKDIVHSPLVENRNTTLAVASLNYRF